MACDHRGVQRVSRAATRPHSRRSAPPSAQVLQDNGYSTFWLGKNHNVPERGRRRGRQPQVGVAAAARASTASTASSAARPTSGTRTSSRTTTSSSRRTRPEEGYHLSKDLADQAIKMIRDQKSANPSKPWFMWFCPGRQPRAAPRPAGVHRQVQGQVRRRLRGLPRVGAGAHDREGRPAEGHRADADQPDAEDVANPADDVRPWNTLNADEKKLFCAHGRGLRRVLRVHRRRRSAASSTTSSRPGSSTTRSIFYCADNGASGEGTPERLGQREQVLQRLPRRARREHEATRRARRPGHLQPLPDRLGGRRSRRRSRCSSATRSTPAARAIRWSSPGRRASRRGRDPPPVPPLHRHRADDPRRRRPRDAQGLPRRRAVPALRRVDALHASTTPTRRRTRSASTTRCSAPAASGRTAGRPPPCTRRSAARATSTRTSGSSTTSTWTARSRTDLAEAVSGEARGADQGLGRGGRGQLRPAAR